jgi:hypothetical protein
MSVMLCITCGDLVDTDFEDYNFETCQCIECEEEDGQ